MADDRITVEILGQPLTLKGIGDADYARKLASLVDARMRAIRGASTLDLSKTALLTAINLADELLQARERLEHLNHDTEADAQRLTALVEAAFS